MLETSKYNSTIDQTINIQEKEYIYFQYATYKLTTLKPSSLPKLFHSKQIHVHVLIETSESTIITRFYIRLNTSDLMSNAAGTCSKTWDRIGPKATSLQTSRSPEDSTHKYMDKDHVLYNYMVIFTSLS